MNFRFDYIMRITVSEINIGLIFENICSTLGLLNVTSTSALCANCNDIRKSTGNVQYLNQKIFMECNYICKYAVVYISGIHWSRNLLEY